jgi:hypothetical protein
LTVDAVGTVESKLDAILSELHDLRAHVYRLALPVDVLTQQQAAARLGKCSRTLHTLATRGVFSDGRAPGNRVKGSPRLYYADEIDVYRAEGEAGVRRLRGEVGRAEPECVTRRRGRRGQREV